MAKWTGPEGKEMLINQAELLPVGASRLVWSRQLRGRRVLHFMYNNGVRDALIKGHSAAADSGDMLIAIMWQDARNGVAAWFDRVVSESNPADGPSRMDFALMIKIKATRVEAIIPRIRHSFGIKWGEGADGT